ncbi:carbon-nitrogen hydrolase family protein [Mycolicibacterium peregrinum]|uniref:Carbon-nitrogen hydrolase n=1 Tax=Mycolicibacterium peregrinum TaxID=43304 RepID=A0A1A0VPY3_MYCPR|nr:carbon-nitrogen hydrolase family protein [Mycolicibacterium peregrinum]OBB85278.1 carbon-nitrogen hydrolase [Mycolicibacterium peregrinum]
MKVAVGQFSPSGRLPENIRAIEGLAKRAADSAAELLVLPEESMFTSDLVVGNIREEATAGWPQFVDAIAELAQRFGLTVIAGGYEGMGAANRPYNTIVAVDGSGTVIAEYRKTHLYDAFAYRESDYVQPGDGTPVVVAVGDFNIGLVNCYDIRFPEFSRALVDAGADVLSVSTAWVSGPLKEDHWETLIRARAIENTCWVLASGVASEDCVGRSMIVDPMGVVKGSLGDERDELIVFPLSRDRLAEVRATVPVLANRVLGKAV